MITIEKIKRFSGLGCDLGRDVDNLEKRAIIVAEKLCLTDERYRATDTISAKVDSLDILLSVRNKYDELVEFERIPIDTFISDEKLAEYAKQRKMD